MKPVVVLVGRPNVGKSTLFNRLTRRAAALVADLPGLTRDRQYGDGQVGDRPYLVVDTGGVVDSLHAERAAERRQALADFIQGQTRQALAEADAVILLTDARAGVHPLDRQIASDLRRLGKPVFVAVNKAEGMPPETAVAEFYALGLGEPHAISAAHGDGVAALMKKVLADLPVVKAEAPADVPRIAVVGRPNAGKSTLVNALLGEERVLVSPEPGTTRDSVHVPLERAGKRYLLIDTAGVRRRARIEDPIEKYSVARSLQAVAEANVVILVIDAHAGITEQDAALAGYVLEQGKALVVAVNKWDKLDSAARAWARRELERKLPFLEFVRFHPISALHGTGLAELFRSVDRAFASAHCTLSTPRLNRVLHQALQATAPPVEHGRRIRIKYAHQGGKNPPRIVLHGNQVKDLPESYRRYLANFFRRAFKLEGTPVWIECREGKNPFAGRTQPAGSRKKRK